MLRLDDHVIGLGNGDANFIHRHRLHRLTVHCHYGHCKIRDPEVEIGRRASVDEAQPHPFARLKERRPIRFRRAAVHQIRVGEPRDVRDVGRIHAHAPPLQPICDCGRKSICRHVTEESAQGAPLEVVIVCPPLEFGDDVHRIFGSPIRQHHDVFAVILERLWRGRVNNQRAVMTGLFLTGGMAVIPVGAVLFNRETVGERFAGFDTRETHARHAVHAGRQQQSVPVNRSVFLETIGDP